MGDRHAGLLRRLHDHAPSSTQFIGFLALLVSGAILLFFAGVTLTAAVLGLILLSPVILLTSPIGVPAGTARVVAGGLCKGPDRRHGGAGEGLCSGVRRVPPEEGEGCCSRSLMRFFNNEKMTAIDDDETEYSKNLHFFFSWLIIVCSCDQ